MTTRYRFEFEQAVPVTEAEQTLHLALFAAEGLFGEARVRMDAKYTIDEANRCLVADATTEVGSAVARMFTALLLREFGEEAFRVRRMEPATSQEPAPCPPSGS